MASRKSRNIRKPKRPQIRYAVDLRRLVSLRIVNDCVEQFHVFSLTCKDSSALLGAFVRYRNEIFSALCVVRPGIHVDNLLISSHWRLELSYATHHAYFRYVPGLHLRHQEGKGIEEPQLGEGVACYIVWASYQDRPGVALAKDVHKSPATQFFREVATATRRGVIAYEEINVGDMYKPPTDGVPPYRTILSVPMMWTLRAHADPLKTPVLECLGVLNITHPDEIAFTPQDFVWAQTCASLLGSLHASLNARNIALAPDEEPAQREHLNEILLRLARGHHFSPITKTDAPPPNSTDDSKHSSPAQQLIHEIVESVRASERLIIQFIAGDRGGSQQFQIQAPREFKAIESAILRCKLRDQVDILSIFAATAQEISATYTNNPTIVHFVGQGDDRNLSVIRDHGALVQADLLSAEQLSAMLKSFPNRVRACILNACDSSSIAAQLTYNEAVDIAIGWEGKVDDQTAIAFASSLYEHLGNELSFAKAFESAKACCKHGSHQVKIHSIAADVLSKGIMR